MALTYVPYKMEVFVVKKRLWCLYILLILLPVIVLAIMTEGFKLTVTGLDIVIFICVQALCIFLISHFLLYRPVQGLINVIYRAIKGDYHARFFSYDTGGVLNRLSFAFNELMNCVESQMKELSENRILQNKLYENEKIYRSALELTCERLFEADLTHNKVLYGYDSYHRAFPFLQTEMYDEMIRLLSEKVVCTKDAKKFCGTFSRGNLADTFLHKNTKEVTMEYRLLNNSGGFVWYFATVVFLNSSETDSLKIIGYIKNINARKKHEIEIFNQSQKDGLTGLYNKKVTQDMIESFISGDGCSGHHALIMVDIDNFKRINDTMGHTEGDSALVQVAHKLKSLFRTSDIVGRVGGDEFLTLMKNISSLDVLIKKLDSIKQYFNEIHLKDNSFRISGSIGVSFYPYDSTSFFELYKMSDAALYNSKKIGKNCFSFYGFGNNGEKPDMALQPDKNSL